MTHVAGIIPLAHQPFDYGMPWHDCLMPIAPNYLAVEQAVAECAYAGCETIWIILSKDATPLIRHRLKDYVEDPYYLEKHRFVKHPLAHRKQIPIYYVSIHPRHQGKRESIPWSIIYGAEVATKISKQISTWLQPTKFFVSSAYGAYHPMSIRKYRREVSDPETNVCLTYDQCSVTSGDHLAFTFNHEDLRNFKKIFRKLATGIRDTSVMEGQGIPQKNLPVKERYSGRFLTMKDIMENYSEWAPDLMIEIDWYFDISSWEGFRRFSCSMFADRVRRPGFLRMNGKVNPIGEEED